MKNLINNIAQVAINKQGGTFRVFDGEPSKNTKGYYVGGSGVCYIIPFEFISGAKWLQSLLAKCIPNLKAVGYIGVWYSEENNAIYIERTDHFENLESAIVAGLERNQIAIFDIENQKDIIL